MDQEKKNQEELEIDVRALLYALWKHIGFIIISAVLCGAIVFVYSKCFIAPKYVSTSSLFVLNRNNENSLSSSDITSSAALANDFAELATSHLVVDGVIEQLGLGEQYTYSKLSSEISVMIKDNTRVLKISVKDKDPEMAKMLVDSVSDALIEVIENKVKIEANKIDTGVVPTKPSSPNVTKYTILGCLLGAILAITVTVVTFLLDDTIKTEADVEKYLHVTVLASIPLMDKDAGKAELQKEKTQVRSSKKKSSRKGGR